MSKNKFIEIINNNFFVRKYHLIYNFNKYLKCFNKKKDDLSKMFLSSTCIKFEHIY